jgi:DNA-binding transcriptional ArsR family regulator
VFGALADPTRRTIVERLTGGEATVSQLAEPFDVSLTSIAKHLRVLEDAGLVATRKEGRIRRCRLVEDPLADAISWMAGYGAFWEDRLDSLEQLLADRRRRSER